MKETLINLCKYLESKREYIVRTEKIKYGDSDPTYGMPTIGEIEVIDFDKLLDEIDNFARGYTS